MKAHRYRDQDALLGAPDTIHEPSGSLRVCGGGVHPAKHERGDESCRHFSGPNRTSDPVQAFMEETMEKLGRRCHSLFLAHETLAVAP